MYLQLRGTRVAITTVVFLNVATFQHLKLCNVTKFPTFGIMPIVTFSAKVSKRFSQDVAMSIIPQIIGETFPTYWETSPLVGNYLKSQVLTSSL